MSVDITVRSESEHGGRDMKADGVDDNHPLSISDDLITSCSYHNQVQSRPQDQSLSCDHRPPANREEEYCKPLEVPGRQIHELEEEAKGVRDDTQPGYEKRPEVESAVVLEGEKDHEC